MAKKSRVAVWPWVLGLAVLVLIGSLIGYMTSRPSGVLFGGLVGSTPQGPSRWVVEDMQAEENALLVTYEAYEKITKDSPDSDLFKKALEKSRKDLLDHQAHMREVGVQPRRNIDKGKK